MASEEPCGLEGLPAEIFLTIAGHLEDLPSLHNLLCASPSMFRLFNNHGVGLVNTILAGYFPRQIPELFCIIALIRSSKLPIQTLQEFIDQFVIKSQLQINDSVEGFLPHSLLENTSVKMLRGLLTMSYQISRLSTACTLHYLDRLMTIQPVQPGESDRKKIESMMVLTGQNPFPPIMYDWERRKEGHEWTIPDTYSSPHFNEVHRVIRAFWYIQLFHELKKAVLESRLHWLEEDLERMRIMDIMEFYDLSPSYQSNFEKGWDACYKQYREEIYTVIEYIQKIRPKSLGNLEPNIKLLLHLLRAEPWSSPPMPGPDDDVDRAYINFIGSYQTIWKHIAESSRISIMAPLPMAGMSFAPFRRLGFALWEHERLAAWGLIGPRFILKEQREIETFNQKKQLPVPACNIHPQNLARPQLLMRQNAWMSYFFNWRSILTDDQVIQAKLDIQRSNENMG